MKDPFKHTGRTQHHNLLIHSEENVVHKAASRGLHHTDPQPLHPAAQSTEFCLLWSGWLLKSSRGSVRMNLMSHSRIICESLFESESQNGRPLQTRSGFGSLVGNEAYFPVLSAAITYKPDSPCPDLKGTD